MKILKTIVKKRHRTLLEKMSEAEFSIWWITDEWNDRGLLVHLTEKARRNVSVELLCTNPPEIDRQNETYFRDFLEAGGELYYLQNHSPEHIRTSPCCLIDGKMIVVKENKAFTGYRTAKLPETVLRKICVDFLMVKNRYCRNINRIEPLEKEHQIDYLFFENQTNTLRYGNSKTDQNKNIAAKSSFVFEKEPGKRMRKIVSISQFRPYIARRWSQTS